MDKFNRLYEVSQTPQREELTDGTPQQPQPDEYTVMEANAVNQYMQGQKKDSLAFNISVPETLGQAVQIKRAPEDINNLMTSFTTNKARKTQNIGGVMVDPVQTYNNADDLCDIAFGKFFQSGVGLEKNKEQAEKNKQDVGKGGDTFESYNYNGFPVLNESPLSAGVAAGEVAGGLGAAGLQFMTGVGASLATTMGPTILALGLGSQGVGMALQAAFGDVTGHGATNDAVTKHLADPRKMMIQTAAQMPQQKGNIVQQIDEYTAQIVSSINDLVSAISPSATAEVGAIRKYVNGFKVTATDEIASFIKENSDYIKKQKEQEEQERMSKLRRQKDNATDMAEFFENIQKGMTSLSPDEIAMLGKIGDYFKKHVDKSEGDELLEASKKGAKEVVSTYLALTKKKVESLNSDIANNSLNEADSPTQAPKKEIPVEKIYNNILAEMQNKFGDLVAKFNPKELSNLEETKTEMKNLITAADNEIKHKIEQITKAPTTDNYSRETGLGSAAIKFLMGHPLEAETLQGIWSRHLGDLNSRMNTRIKQMTDMNNPGRTLGWTKRLLMDTVPQILARLMALRYAYGVLSNEGVYNYDTAKTKEDLQNWKNDPSLRIQYINANKNKLLYLLAKFSADYTSTGNSCVIETENGFEINPNSIMDYGSFLISKLHGGLYNNPQLINAYGLAIANIQKSKDPLNALLTIIYENMSDRNVTLLNTTDPDYNKNKEAFNKLAKSFQMSEDIKGLKDTIKTAYDNIVAVGKQITDDNANDFAKSLEIIFNNPTIFNIYKKNADRVDNLISLAKNFDENEDEIRKGIKQVFNNNINFEIENKEKVTKDTIDKLFQNNDFNQEYYTYILSWFGSKNLNNIKYEKETITASRSADGIKKVCEMVPVLLKIAVSGILITGINNEDDEEETNEVNIDEVKKNILYYLQDYYITKDGAKEAGYDNDEMFTKYISVVETKIENIFKNIIVQYNNIDEKQYKISEEFFKKDHKELISILMKEQNEIYNDLKQYEVSKGENKKSFESLDDDTKESVVNNIYDAIQNAAKAKESNFSEFKKDVETIAQCVTELIMNNANNNENNSNNQ